MNAADDEARAAELMREQIAGNGAAAAILIVLNAQPQAPRNVSKREGWRLARSLPGGITQTLLAIPLIGVFVLMMEKLTTPPPPPQWLFLPALAVLGCLGAAWWELRMAIGALRDGGVHSFTIDRVVGHYASPEGYEAIGKLLGHSVLARGPDGDLMDWPVAPEVAKASVAGLRLLAFPVGKRWIVLDVER